MSATNINISNNNAGKRSPAQAEQSRINGAKSHGPITAEGKCKISKNRMTHGFRSNHIALNNEDKEQYDAHLASYMERYTPADKVESDLVGLLASNMWQIMRINSVEVALFDIEISGIDVMIHGEFTEMDQYGRLALAFKKSSGENALELLRRYKSTAERAYHRALQAIEEIQKNRKPQPPATEETKITVQTREPHPPSPIQHLEPPVPRSQPLTPCEPPPPTTAR